MLILPVNCKRQNFADVGGEGGGGKNGKILRTSFMDGPLTKRSTEPKTCASTHQC